MLYATVALRFDVRGHRPLIYVPPVRALCCCAQMTGVEAITWIHIKVNNIERKWTFRKWDYLSSLSVPKRDCKNTHEYSLTRVRHLLTISGSEQLSKKMCLPNWAQRNDTNRLPMPNLNLCLQNRTPEGIFFRHTVVQCGIFRRPNRLRLWASETHVK